MPARADFQITAMTVRHIGAPRATLASRRATCCRRSTSSVVRVITGAAISPRATAPARPEKPFRGATSTS